MDLLQKRSSFSPYVIKPDLPADVRLREKVLLKERWDLIQSGTCKSNIKIKGSTLLVNGSPFGRVDQSCNFVRCDENSTFVPMSAATSSTSPNYSTPTLNNPNPPVTNDDISSPCLMAQSQLTGNN